MEDGGGDDEEDHAHAMEGKGSSCHYINSITTIVYKLILTMLTTETVLLSVKVQLCYNEHTSTCMHLASPNNMDPTLLLYR